MSVIDVAGIVATGNCVLACNSESLVSGHGDGDPISQWDDESGGGNHPNKTGTNRPLFTLAHPDHDWPAVLFGPTNAKHFDVPNIFSGASAGEIWLAVRANFDPPANGNQTGLWRFGTDSQADHFPFTDGSVYDGSMSTARKTVGNPSLTLNAVRILRIVSKASDWRIYLDGNLIGSTTSNTVGFSTTPKLGLNASGSQYFDGYVFGIYAFTTERSAGDVTFIQSELDKYKAAFGLPPDAPSVTVVETEADRQVHMTVEDVSGTGTGSGDTEYIVEIDIDGAGFNTLIDWTTDRPDNDLVYVGAQDEGTATVRARARKAVVGESANGTTDSFEITHSAFSPAKATASWIGSSDLNVFGRLSAFSHQTEGAFAAKSHWEIAADGDPTFTSPLQQVEQSKFDVSIGILGIRGIFDTAILSQGTNYWVRGRYEDDLEHLGDWSDPIRVHTTIIHIVGHIGNGDLSWGGGAVNLGLAIEDLSGNGRHGRHIRTVGNDGSSYLNQGATVLGPKFPVGIAGAPFGGSAKIGTYLRPDETPPAFGGGQSLIWSVTDASADKLSLTRHDAQAFMPDWGLLLEVTPEFNGTNPGHLEQMLCEISEAKDTGLPTATRWFIRVHVTAADPFVVKISMDNTSGFPVLTSSTELVEGETTLLRISHKYHNSSGGRSVVRVNEEIVYDSTPFTILSNIANIGNFRCGVMGSADLAQNRHFHGVYSEAALWWNESDLDYTDPNDLPKVEAVAADPDAILAADEGLVLYWRMGEPYGPSKPVVSAA